MYHSAVNAGELHRLAHLLREIATTATADPGELPVAPGYLAVVEDIARHAGTSVSEVARRTGLAQSLVSRTVAALRESHVVVSSPDPADGRRSLISLDPTTRAGLFRARAARSIEPAVRAHRPELAEKDQLRVGKLLDDLAARLQP